MLLSKAGKAHTTRCGLACQLELGFMLSLPGVGWHRQALVQLGAARPRMPPGCCLVLVSPGATTMGGTGAAWYRQAMVPLGIAGP